MINFDIINKLLKEKMSEERVIYVLKGFNLILNKIEIPIRHIFNFGLEKDIYLVKSINKKDILKQISSLEGDNCYCLYEEMQVISSLNILGAIDIIDYKIKIINFNLFEYFYPGFIQPNNYEKMIEDMENNTDSDIQEFYSSLNIERNFLYVSYNPIQQDVVELNLFDIGHKKISSDNIDQFIEVYSSSSMASLISIVGELINNGSLDVKYIIGDKDSTSINKFLNILKLLGIKIKIERQRLEETLPTRVDDYLEILKRIDAKYTFKSISMYKDPFNSNEKTKINQSIIIDEIVTNIEKAHNKGPCRDIFITAPTGAGKSILFQIPAIYALEKYGLLTLVVSPLIGLMKDQVFNLKKMTNKVETINSEYTPFQKDEIKEKINNGEISILYVSPETLLSNSDIETLIGKREIGLLVVDEAHTVATWGKNFRPDYWYLGEFIYKLRHRGNYQFPIATFTATATIGDQNDMYHDIVDSLKMNPISFIGDVKRYNIKFDITKHKKVLDYQQEKFDIVRNKLLSYSNQENEKTLAYFPYVSILKDIFNSFKQDGVQGKFNPYYGGLDKTIKDASISNLRNNEIPVVLATKAFGMGIDIKDIKNVYHFAPTGNVADYVQEIGRVARDEKMIGIASTDYFEEDFRYINQLYGMSQIKNYNIIGVLKKIMFVFQQKRKRNFLISPEDFAFAFDANSQDDIENKLKTTLLIIKKDFEKDKTLNYAPLIFKPRGMFTRGIFLIKDEDLTKVNKKWWKYLKIKYTKKELKRTYSTKTYSYLGDVYEFDFRRCWEENYNHISFGNFKNKFFNNKLEGNDTSIYIQKILLNIETKHSLFNEVIENFVVIINKIKDCLDDFKTTGKFFSQDEFSDSLFEFLKDIMDKKKVYAIVPPLLSMLNSVSNIDNGFGRLYFIRYNSKKEKYSIVNYSYDRFLSNVTKILKNFLQDSLQSNTKFAVLNKEQTSLNNMRTDYLLIGVQLLELFDFVSYSYQAGDRPELFIRVNSSYPINKIINDSQYSSKTIELVRNLHCESVGLLKYFFENLNTDSERWDFIEQYFLGEDLCTKYNIHYTFKNNVIN